METPQPPNPDRELALRQYDGLTVSLMWCPGTTVTYVTVQDNKMGQTWRRATEVGEKPLDVFKHPFAYMAQVDLIQETPTWVDQAVPDVEHGAEA